MQLICRANCCSAIYSKCCVLLHIIAELIGAYVHTLLHTQSFVTQLLELKTYTCCPWTSCKLLAASLFRLHTHSAGPMLIQIAYLTFYVVKLYLHKLNMLVHKHNPPQNTLQCRVAPCNLVMPLLTHCSADGSTSKASLGSGQDSLCRGAKLGALYMPTQVMSHRIHEQSLRKLHAYY